MSLFERESGNVSSGVAPLAERMRPRAIDEIVGQNHLLGPGKALRRLLEEGRPISLILWGPPGTGKTTLARLLAQLWDTDFTEFSAVLSGVADVRRAVEEARAKLKGGRRTTLFVDEIHRFNKSQQDAFLPHVESGVITLVGATTENPSFEVAPALLSRLRVLVLHPLEEDHLALILERALADAERGLGGRDVELTPEAKQHMIQAAYGDARRLLGTLEVAVEAAPLGLGGLKRIDQALAEDAVGRRMLRYDKAGEEHYNLISALHKSLRGSDVDAALYWLTRMLEAGEDPHFILRRLTRFACEDVGLADSYALNQLVAAWSAFDKIGLPEADLMLAQAVVYLALAPKSNAVYAAMKAVRDDVRRFGPLEVPLQIRNAPTKLMKNLDYGKGYEYPHDFAEAMVGQEYMPPELVGKRYYHPTQRGREKFIGERMAQIVQARARLRKKEKGDETT
ncbi:AAA ATPase central domain protein [Desulfarculus baarsii DSM 2075]|uniref:Replication-associated recombination protein A n=1 Tax=Desulfarculus baarsii (strain ATCC 33931 / DSM 2075 / LMG 7858 / VKM B-1802 / 2st14) TaxID=644282 RepID=E1QL20_DESB2|nr:replication-associated recombination protein A [Desulfarculus baarsii]ADK85285.1 AAA ATPase central domain protein [Desulfarculus baarsii DSM 2075]